MQQQRPIVIRGGRLVDAKARKAEPKDIVVVGDTIREIGRPGIPAPEGADAIDATDKALIPGLVNAHTHSHGNLAKAFGDRITLELLLNANVWANFARTDGDKYLSAKIGAVEMLRRGCTACYDLAAEAPGLTVEGMTAVGQAYLDVGMRAVVAPMMADRTAYEAIPGLIESLPASLGRTVAGFRTAPHAATLETARRLLKAWPFDRERVALALAPTIPLLCSDDFLKACLALAREAGVGLHTHMAESRVWAVGGQLRYNRSLTAHFDSLGILGPSFTAAHAVWIDGDDMKRMADRGASVAHNPSSNMRLGSGLADVRAMRRAGVNVGLGTDAAHCGDHLNMFEAMRLASYSSRVQAHEYPDWIAADESLALATEGSAKALGFGDRIGRLAPGAKADIVFLDLSDIAFVPLNDITNQIVHSADSSAVESVMVGGRMVVERRRVVTINEAKLRREAEAAAERLAAAQAERRAFAAELDPHVGSHCSGLARQFRRA